MQHARQAVFLAVVVSICFPNHAWSQTRTARPSKSDHALSLTPANNGQHLYSAVGQLIQVDLQALTPSGYESPLVSGSSIEYRNSVLLWPPNPGGPLPLYMFEAVSAGIARIQFPRNNGPGFDVTIEVRPTAKRFPTSLVLDQANTALWREGWMNLFNRAQQTFTPSLRTLAGVEVELVVANPGASAETVSMMLLGPDGQGLLQAEKEVPSDNCAHVLFLLPAGFEVTPGQPYTIQISDGSGGLFGWKYVTDGYNRGEALFNGKPLSKARSTFLFRTFGLN